MPSWHFSRSPFLFRALQVWQPMKCCTKLICSSRPCLSESPRMPIPAEPELIISDAVSANQACYIRHMGCRARSLHSLLYHSLASHSQWLRSDPANSNSSRSPCPGTRPCPATLGAFWEGRWLHFGLEGHRCMRLPAAPWAGSAGGSNQQGNFMSW